jgi:succinate dehydrogenase / fumarate reductase cytochrome b subunit
MLLVGRSSWSSFLSLVTAKSFLALEAVLIAAVLFHGLNGIRVALVGSGIAVARERALLWAAGAITTVAAILAALHILGAL